MSHKFRSRLFVIFFALALGALALLNACGGGPAAPSATQAAAASPTQQPKPTTEASPTAGPTTASVPTATAKASRTPKPTSTPKPTTTLSAALNDVIQDAVMAAGVAGLDLAPQGVSDTFSPEQGTFHAVVSLKDSPRGTRFKAVWTAVDTAGASPANSSLGEYELTAEGTRFIDFTYKPYKGHMSAGSYKVDIYVNGKLARTLDFTVSETAQVITPGAPGSSTPCPPLERPTDTSPSFPIGVTMATKTQGANYEPVNPGRVFGPKDVFHAVVNIKDAPDNTNFKAVWYAEEVGDAAPCNYKLNEGALSSGGSRNLDFYISPGAEWPRGTFRVEIYVNDILTITTTFTVTNNPASAVTETTEPLPAGTPTPEASPPSAEAVVYPVKVFYQDAPNDCIANDTSAQVSCNPSGVDILSVTVTRLDATGPLTIILETAGQSLKGNPLWGMTYAIDLDRNVSTGLRDVYPSQHGIGPELYLLYGEVNGAETQLIKRYAADGKETDLDASLTEWNWLDDNHLRVVVDSSLIPVERFNLVGDLTVKDMFDHFVEGGYLMFPEGQPGHK